MIQKPDTSHKELWDTGGFSSRVITGPNDKLRGVQCKPIHPTFRNVRVMLGLTSGAGVETNSAKKAELHNPHYATITYSIFCFGTNLYIYEEGKEKGGYGQYGHEDDLALVINSSGNVEYRINGKAQYTSEIPVVYPLHVKIAAYTPGGLLQEISWVEK